MHHDDDLTDRRAIFLDVDGTLINHEQRLSASAAQAVRRARERGHAVLLATGRSRAEILPELYALGNDGVISAGGGYVEIAGTLLARRAFPPEDVATMVEFFEEHDIEYVLQGFEHAVSSPGAVARLASAVGIDFEELFTGDATSDSYADVAKVSFLGTDPTTFARVRGGLQDRFTVITGTMPYVGESGGEVSPVGVHKGRAALDALEALGILPARAVAIGDSVNDLELFDAVGLGIAMGNADEAVKARADEITAGVDEDGVWLALERHGLL